jgi:uncharacterized damage-inducible protein DinB
VSTREFMIARRNAEFPAFQRVLDALPRDHWAYKPHERSPSAGSLVWTLATETKACCDLIQQGHIDWQVGAPPEDPDEVKRLHDSHYQELTRLVSHLDSDAWARNGQLRAGGKTMMEMPLGDLLWFFFFDAIHHRGQLSTYIRPMGGRVPAIYGPSGDDPGGTIT